MGKPEAIKMLGTWLQGLRPLAMGGGYPGWLATPPGEVKGRSLVLRVSLLPSKMSPIDSLEFRTSEITVR